MLGLFLELLLFPDKCVLPDSAFIPCWMDEMPKARLWIRLRVKGRKQAVCSNLLQALCYTKTKPPKRNSAGPAWLTADQTSAELLLIAVSHDSICLFNV